jgi:hypothetical protein
MAKNKEKKGPHLKAAKKAVYPVVVHELGHWLMAKKVSFETGDLQIKLGYHGKEPWAEGSATVILQVPLGTIDDAIGYMEKRIAVLCAGAHAESLITCPEGTAVADHFDHVLHSNGLSDYQKAEELATLSRNVQQAKVLDRSNEAQERWDQLVQALEKYQFTATEKEQLSRYAEEFSEEIIKQFSQGVYPHYFFSKERLDKVFIDILALANAPKRAG